MNLKYLLNKPRILSKLILNLKNWYLFIANYLGLVKSKTLIYETRNGIKIKVRTNSYDSRVVSEIICYRIYQKDGFEIKDNYVIVDIGANIGCYALFAAFSADNVKVFCFEPNEENYNLLMENIAMNGLKGKIIPYKYAVAGQNKKVELLVSKSQFNTKHYESISMYEGIIKNIPDTHEILKEEVDAISLEKVFKLCQIDKIDLLKLDCEGAEYEIILSSSSDTLRKISKIVLEYHRFDNKDENVLKDFLISHGFSVQVINDPNNRIGMIFAKSDKY
ncbi:MAG: FkbM family methyltransferase [Candidatus Anstonellales archaeon]